TKGSLMTELLSNKQWWNGPPVNDTTLMEFTVGTIITESRDDKCTTKSDYAKALGPYRQIAKWLKITFAGRYASVDRDQLALILLIRRTQLTHFQEEMTCIQTSSPIVRSSILRQ